MCFCCSIIPTDEEIAKLPHVCREKLDLTQFLGSGAFGEVYEGVVHDVLPDRPGPVKCAVKVKIPSDGIITLKQNYQILGLYKVCWRLECAIE